jgi:peptidoglycan hydrolase CwlO-like protein
MTDSKKAKFITSSIHAVIGRAGAPADVVAPGERVPLDPENDTHKYLVEQIEAGNSDYEHLSVLEVSLKDEAKQQEELQEKLAEGEKIAAQQRQEEAQAAIERQEETDELRARAEEEGQPPVGQQADFPPQDVRAQDLARQSGAGQRASTQDDVADEDQPKSGRRSGRGGKG